MFKLIARGIAVLGLAALPLAPIHAFAGGGGGGGAGTGITITLPASADLSNRVVANVPVTVQCSPLPSDFAFGGLTVTTEQAFGRDLAQGYGYTNLDPSTCDGSPHVVSVPVSAWSLAYHGGPAMASAWAQACDTLYDCIGGSAGPQTIKLH